MTIPSNITVELAFGGAVRDTNGVLTYTDVTSDVKSIQIRRGRPSRFDLFPTGSCTIVLQDADRDFDPTNTGSPYRSGGATQVLPNVPVRVTADDSTTTTQTIFRGFVSAQNGWSFDYSTDPAHSLVTIAANDLTAWLAQYHLAEDDLDDYYVTATRETPITRLAEILKASGGGDVINLPDDWVDLDSTGAFHLLTQRRETEAALEHIQAVAIADAGVFFTSRDGKATYRGRLAPMQNANQSSSQETFSDDGSNVPYLHDSLQWTYVTDVRDKVIVQASGSDDPQQKGTGDSAMSRTDVNVTSITEALGLAEYWYDQFSTSQFAPDSLSILPAESNAALDAATQLDLRYRVTVEHTPPNTGDNTQIVHEAFVDRIDHAITPGRWVTTFGFTSAEPTMFDSDPFLELDVGNLDSATSGVLAY